MTASGRETVFTMDTSSIKFGAGATREVGDDMQALGAKRVMVVTDPRIAPARACGDRAGITARAGIDAVLYDRVRVEPTDASFQAGDRLRDRGELRRLRRRRRRLEHRHRQGGQSLRDLSACRLPGLCQRADRPGRAGARAAQTADRHSDHRRHRQRDDRRRDLRPRELHAKTGIAHRALRPMLGISIPTTRATCRRRSPHRPGSTC